MTKRGTARPMKAGSFRDSVAKTVRLLTRDQVQVSFRGFQPMVVTKGDKVVMMVLPEIGDDASPELVEAMQGFLDHECGHIFFTPFARAQAALKGMKRGEAKMRQVFNNIVEDIRLEKLLPRQLPGTKDNLERMYDAVMEKFFGRSINQALQEGADPERMMGATIVVGFRALAGQKAFMRYMDDNDLWKWLTPLTERMPTLAKELQSMETYDDVERIVQMVLDAMDPKLKERVEDAMEQQPPMDMPEANCGDPALGSGDQKSDDSDQTDENESGDSGDSADADDEEGNSSEGDEANEGQGGAGDEDDETSDAEPSPGAEDSENEGGGKGHGDGSGEDDGSDEESGSCSSDEEGGDDNGDSDADREENDSSSSDDSESNGKSSRSITDALKQLEPTQRKVLYLHKNKKRSVTRIAEKMQISEDEVKSLLGSARRNLATIMTGSK